MIQEHIIKPFLDTIIENSYFNQFIEVALIVLLAISFIYTLERGVLYVWSKLFINS